MSSSSSSDMVETDLETQAPSRSAMPEVMLSFDNSVGGAWDDRELIRAYDAALDEFHVNIQMFRASVGAYTRCIIRDRARGLTR